MKEDNKQTCTCDGVKTGCSDVNCPSKNQAEENFESKMSRPTMSYYQVKAQIKYLQGKVLTFVDATTSNERQNKASKDIINQIFGSQIKWIHDSLNDFNVIMASSPDLGFPPLPSQTEEEAAN